jgi:hypothetical protein
MHCTLDLIQVANICWPHRAQLRLVSSTMVTCSFFEKARRVPALAINWHQRCPPMALSARLCTYTAASQITFAR